MTSAPKDPTPRRLLVPLDFSDDSTRALDYARAMAERTESELVVMTVIEDTFPYPELFAWDHPDEEFYKFMRQKAMAHFDQVLGEDSSARRVVVRGRPAEEIVAVADQVEADVIILAKHGSSGLRTALMGSTTESVVRGSHRPVLVLPADPGDGS